jgi:EPS-associated MarR family transcriptional regulator
MPSDEINYRILKLLEENSSISQRELAKSLGVSVGKVNYCVRALLDKGWMKVRNFRNSQNKLAYSYLVTPAGIDGKARLTLRFLQRKIGEYERITAEIEQLRREVQSNVEIGD